jgi:hypothetical protein
MQKRIGNQSSAKFQPRSPGTSMEISDSSDDDRGQPPAAAVRGNPGQANRAGTGSSSAHSSRHAGPSSSELSESDDAGSRRGARKAVPVYKTPSKAPSRAGGRESPAVRFGGSSRPTTAGMNRGLGGAGAGDDMEMIEHAIDRQQHGIKRAGNNAVTRAVNAARHHSHRQSDSEISASSEEEQRVPRSISRASMAAVQRSQASVRAQSVMDESDDDVLSDEAAHSHTYSLYYSDSNRLCNRPLTVEHFCQAFHAPSRQAPRSAMKLDKLNRAPVAGSGPAPSATPSKTPLRQLPQHAARMASSPEPARVHGGQALNPLANRPGLSAEERGSPMRTGSLLPLANTPGAG